MDKPEELKQLARTIVLVCQYTWPKDREKNVQKAEKLLETFVSEAILSAQSQAYIDAARIASEQATKCADISKAFVAGQTRLTIPEAMDWACNEATHISAAILQRKEEIGRN